MRRTDSARNTHYTRKRSTTDKQCEEAYKDWYGTEIAVLEIESLQHSMRKIADVMNDVLTSLDKNDNILLREIVDRWEELVGRDIQHHARPRRIKDKVLFIEVYETAWRFHLERNLKPEIRKLICSASGGRITTIRFITGGKTRWQRTK